MLYNSLHRTGGPAHRRAAFSLAELVISMGILLLMLSLAGQVFNLTIQSTGQATALTESMQLLRVFEQTLREDLRHVHPGRSVLLIQGNPVNAYWTADGKAGDDNSSPVYASDGTLETPYPHSSDAEREDRDGRLVAPRADVLMFFTESSAASITSPSFSSATSLTSSLQQVVYGHSELGEYLPDPNEASGFAFAARFPTSSVGASPQAFPSQNFGGAGYPSTTIPSADPAENWHLARRSVLLLPTDSPACAPVAPATTPITRLDDARLLTAETDVVCNFDYDRMVTYPQWDSSSGAAIGEFWYPPRIFGNVQQPFATWFNPFERSRMDPTPPPTLSTRLAHYMLPRCASFKVEWSLNPRSEFVRGRLNGIGEVFWFDPGDNGDPADSRPSPDPLRTLEDRVAGLKQGNLCPADDVVCQRLDSLLNDRTTQADGYFYSLSDRFRTNALPSSDPTAWDPIGPASRPNPGNLVLFAANRPSPSGVVGQVVPDDIFPGALRITIDLYDRDRRLDKPIRHVMVIPVGE